MRSTVDETEHSGPRSSQNAHAPVARRTAVGYVRSSLTESQWPELAAARIQRYGERSGYTVSAVLRDETRQSPEGSEPGFVALMAEVRARGAAAVIVRSAADLSLEPDVRRWMARMVRLAGCELVVTGQPAIGRAPATSLSETGGPR